MEGGGNSIGKREKLRENSVSVKTLVDPELLLGAKVTFIAVLICLRRQLSPFVSYWIEDILENVCNNDKAASYNEDN